MEKTLKKIEKRAQRLVALVDDHIAGDALRLVEAVRYLRKVMADSASGDKDVWAKEFKHAKKILKGKNENS